MKDLQNVVWDDSLYNLIKDKLSRKPVCRQTEREVTRYYNARQTIYPDGRVVIKRYKIPLSYKDDGVEYVDDSTRLPKTAINDIEVLPVEGAECVNKKEGTCNEKKVLENMQKTRNKIYDICASNIWTHFITLTYNSKSCDRYDFAQTSKKVRQFLNNFAKYHKTDCPNFRYLIVHECHKDGAYHYHGLIYLEDDSTMTDSGHRTKKDQPIYNWDKWLNGWSTATKISNLDACCHYITKYVTKSIGDDYQKGQRRFYYSQNCAKPVVDRLNLSDEELQAYDEVYSTDISTGYEADIKSVMRERYGIDD